MLGYYYIVLYSFTTIAEIASENWHETNLLKMSLHWQNSPCLNHAECMNAIETVFRPTKSDECGVNGFLQYYHRCNHPIKVNSNSSPLGEMISIRGKKKTYKIKESLVIFPFYLQRVVFIHSLDGNNGVLDLLFSFFRYFH